ncbi:hypothetical protein AAFC00_000782 [Neodothiora populina]|uniref:Uncharacterized protein n=1 Tax=Neodothiora populina TaxID=2781224 RepID=A0ABR3PMT3_9PEZI
MTRYSICEPHPTVPSRGRPAYIQAGRGGAGNIKRYNSHELTHGPAAAGPASRADLSPPPTTAKFTAGRGGAGNTFTRSPEQRAIFSFDEELKRDEMIKENMSKTPIYHIGRGGAGNAINEMEPKGGRNGSMLSGSSRASTSSNVSNRARSIFRTLSRTISRDSKQ